MRQSGNPESLNCDRCLSGILGFWQLLGDVRADCFRVWLIWGYAWKGMCNRHQGEHFGRKDSSSIKPQRANRDFHNHLAEAGQVRQASRGNSRQTSSHRTHVRKPQLLTDTKTRTGGPRSPSSVSAAPSLITEVSNEEVSLRGGRGNLIM